MEWMLAAFVLVGTFVLLGYRKRLKNAALTMSNMQRLANQARAADNALVLSVLAREVANELMQRDEGAYKDKFERLYYKWRDIEKKAEGDKLAHLQTITSKYVTFLDFDELGTKAHVLYADGFSWKSDDDLWDLYENIRLYDALSCDLDGEWRRNGSSITESELEHLKKYCKQISDTKLLAHLHAAREEYYKLQSDEIEKEEGKWFYETDSYKFCRVPHVAESRWGVYVKEMNRYGMWTLFDYDDYFHTSFYAADADFNEEYLDNLHIRFCLGAKEYDVHEKVKWD